MTSTTLTKQRRMPGSTGPARMISQLREEGFKVYVTHKRFWGSDANPLLVKMVIGLLLLGAAVLIWLGGTLGRFGDPQNVFSTTLSTVMFGLFCLCALAGWILFFWGLQE